MANVLELKNIHQTFYQGDTAIQVLKGITLSIAAGEVVGLVGQSGSGKSTLLHIAGLLERAEKGDIAINGEAVTSNRDGARTKLRLSNIGFVYQFHHLLPEFTALENVIMPQRIANQAWDKAEERAHLLLERMGLADRLDHIPAELSGGEQQRVAIARALANKPTLLLADEPTGNLDEITSNKVMDELINLSHDTGVGALIATHNMDLADRMDRCFTLTTGKLSAR